MTIGIGRAIAAECAECGTCLLVAPGILFNYRTASNPERGLDLLCDKCFKDAVEGAAE